MATKKSSKPSVSLSHPDQYHYSCMANRFATEQCDGFTLAHFGLVNASNLLIDRLTCIFPANTLKALRENLVQYSDQFELPKKKIPTWIPPVRGEKDVSYLPVVDFVHLCHWDNANAEICFWSYSQAKMSDLSSAGKVEIMRPWGIALLRCELDLQRLFLEELYPV